MTIKTVLTFFFMAFSVFGFSQSFLLSPSLDTLFFDSTIYPNIKVGDSIYDYGNLGYYKDSTYTEYLRLLQITNIKTINFDSRREREEYLNFHFDRYIEYKTINQWPISISEDDVFDEGNQSAVKSVFSISFNKQPIVVLVDLGDKIFGNDTVKIDLDKLLLVNNGEVQNIGSFGMFTCLFSDGTQQTIYNITCEIEEGYYNMYYVVVEKGEIKQVYNYYR